MLIGIWLLSGVISSIIATSKGRNGCGWLVLSTLLGPFGFGLVLIAGPKRDAMEEHALKAGDLRACPYCAELNGSNAGTCKSCGADLQ